MPLITPFATVNILRYHTLEFQSVSLEPITDPWYSGILLLSKLGHKRQRFITGAEVMKRGKKKKTLTVHCYQVGNWENQCFDLFSQLDLLMLMLVPHPD